MSAPTIDETVALGVAAGERWTLPPPSDRRFQIALAVALAVHLAFLTGIGRSQPKNLGKEDGREDAISVSLVTEQDLKSRSTIDVPPSAPPSPPVAPPPRPEQPQAQKPVEAPPDPVKEQPKKLQDLKPAIADTEDDEPAPPEEKPAPDQAAAETAAAEKELPDLFSLDKPATTGADSGDKREVKQPKASHEAKKAAKAAPSRPQKKRTAALDLSTPSLSSPGFGGSASFARPPGITRSGLNDAFARAVIRALQQTMPQLRDVLGRVTVKILLNENGNVIDVQRLASRGSSSLGQEVVFAARQTSYPIPPTGSTVADRTFMVTYIYD